MKLLLPFAAVMLLALSPIESRAQLAQVATFVGQQGFALAKDVVRNIAADIISNKIQDYWSPEISEEQRVTGLDRELGEFESALRKVDSDLAAMDRKFAQGLADSVAEFRRELSTKTTPDQVRAIVDESLKSLESRVAGLEDRLGKVDSRIADLEAVLGFLPSRLPIPRNFTRSGVQAQNPVAGPLTKSWFETLRFAELNRIEINRLERTRPETSSVMKEARRIDESTLRKAAEVHERIMAALNYKTQQRGELLKEFKPGSPAINRFDDEIASLIWLAGVSRPVVTEPAKPPRPAVPVQFFELYAPEIVGAVLASGVSKDDVATFYASQWQLMADGSDSLAITLRRDMLDAEMLAIGQDAAAKALHGLSLLEKAEEIDSRLKRVEDDFAAGSPPVEAIVSVREEIYLQLNFLYEGFSHLLEESSRVHIDALATQRPLNRRMIAFRDGVILPIARWKSLLDSDKRAFDESVWNDWVESQRLPRIDRFVGDEETPIADADLSPDNNRFAFAGGPVAEFRWFLPEFHARRLQSFVHQFVKIAVSPTEPLTALGCDDGKVVLYEERTGRERATIAAHSKAITALRFSPDGKRLATGGRDGRVWLWNVADGTNAGQVSDGLAMVRDLAFDRDGSLIAHVSSIWTELDHTAPIKPFRSFGPKGLQLLTHTPDTISVRLFNEDRSIASGDEEGNVSIYDIATGEYRSSIFTGRGAVYSIVALPGGSTLATLSRKENGRSMVDLWLPDGLLPFQQCPIPAGEGLRLVLCDDGFLRALVRNGKSAEIHEFPKMDLKASVAPALGAMRNEYMERLRNRDFVEAYESLQKLLSKFPSEKTPANRSELALLRWRAGQTELAHAELGAALKDDLSSDELAASGSILERALGQFRNQGEFLSEYLKKFPHSPRVNALYAGWLYESGKSEAAIDHARKVIDRYPNDGPLTAAAWQALGRIERARGNELAAEAHFRRALQLQSESWDIKADLVFLLADTKRNTDEAKELVKDAFLIGSNADLQIKDAKGWLNYRLGDLTSARSAYEVAAYESFLADPYERAQFFEHMAIVMLACERRPIDIEPPAKGAIEAIDKAIQEINKDPSQAARVDRLKALRSEAEAKVRATSEK